VKTKLTTTLLAVYLIAVGVLPYLAPLAPIAPLVSLLAIATGVLMLMGR